MEAQKISINRETLAEIAYRHMFQGFLNNELVPGTRLLMDELAEQMGISRTPVREALQRFEREGVIEPHGRRGYVVCRSSVESLDQRYHMREAIEGYALEQIALTGGQVATRLRRGYEQILQQPQTTAAEVFLANRGFHRLMVEVLDNPLLEEGFDLSWGKSLTSGIWVRMLEDSDDLVGDFARLHGPLVEVVESGDGERARAMMLAHINEGRPLHEV